MLYRPTFME